VRKSGVLEHKSAAISLKHVKIEEKLLWRAYSKSQTLFRTVPSPTPYGLLFPKIGGLQLHPKTAIAVISGTAKARDFKFGRHIHRVIRTQAHAKVWRKGIVGVSRDGPHFFDYPLLSQERVKLRTSNLGDVFTASIHANKKTL